MADEDVLKMIGELVKQETAIRESHADHDGRRLLRREETMDQCGNLLRRRRALREFGRDLGEALVRGIDTIETTSSEVRLRVRSCLTDLAHDATNITSR